MLPALSPDCDDVMRAQKRISPYIRNTVDGVGAGRSSPRAHQPEMRKSPQNSRFQNQGRVKRDPSGQPGPARQGSATYSSGNHGQPVAVAANLLQIEATILMPEDAAPEKVEATRRHGAGIIRYDRHLEDRNILRDRIMESEGLRHIHPYDYPLVIAGQGTVALELIEQCGEIDELFVPLGGGGLLAGCALVAAARLQGCQLIGVEPETGNDGLLSMKAGNIITIAAPVTIADGAMTTYWGSHNLRIFQNSGVRIEIADDLELVAAMKAMFDRMKVVAEPTGCLGVARAHSSVSEQSQSRKAAIISGGNVSMQRFCALVRPKEES